MADKWEGTRQTIGTAYGMDLNAIIQDAKVLTAAAPADPHTDKRSAEAEATKSLQSLESGVTISPLPDRKKSLIDRLENYGPDPYKDLPSIAPRFIEQNLDEAGMLLSTCQSLQREYYDTAKAYLATRLELEEFFRLDDVHKAEVSAGLYQLPWIEARSRYQADQTNMVALRDAQTTLEGKQSSGTLSSAKRTIEIGSRASAEGLLAGKPTLNAVETETLELPHRPQVELDNLNWDRARAFAEAELASLSSSVEIGLAKTKYLEQDIWFRGERAAIARDLAYLNLAHHVETQGPLNYADQLISLKGRFDDHMKHLLARVAAISSGLQSIYGEKLPAPPPSDGVLLDGVAGFVLTAQNAVSQARRTERVSLYSISLAGKLGQGWQKKLQDQAPVDIEPIDIGNSEGRLRGIDVEIVQSKDPAPLVQVSVTPPKFTDAKAAAKAPLNLRAWEVSRGCPTSPRFANVTWNLPVTGSWIVKSERAVGADTADVILNIWVAQP